MKNFKAPLKAMDEIVLSGAPVTKAFLKIPDKICTKDNKYDKKIQTSHTK